MGIAITLAFLLWLAEKSRGTQNGNAGVAPGTVAGTDRIDPHIATFELLAYRGQAGGNC
jgi:hypothetical protein